MNIVTGWLSSSVIPREEKASKRALAVGTTDGRKCPFV